jgi:hypothetical protein
MRDKKSYSSEEMAMACEAWRSVSVNDAAKAMENLRKYEQFVPPSVQNAITHLRDIEYGYYGKTPEQRTAIARFTGFGKFKEFFEVFD